MSRPTSASLTASDSLPATAVVIAHGPTGETLTALGRAASLVASDGTLVVVAASEAAQTAVARAGERGVVDGRQVTTVEGHGGEAIAEAIEMTGDEIVLVVHDDVVVTADVISRLVAASDNGRLVVPADRPRRHQLVVEEASLACVVGAATTLADHARIGAFGAGLAILGSFVVPPETVAVHTLACRTRLAGPSPDDGRPLVVAGLIVRDEAQHITECIESLKGLVDRIEVADTGSIDDTAALAEAAGAVVTHIEWHDDFAWARNQVMERCTDAHYLLWVDADERLRCSDPKRFRQILNTHRRMYPSYRVEIHNFSGDPTETEAVLEESHSFWAKRIVWTDGVRFTGALHEQPRREDGQQLFEVDVETLWIDHYGYGEDVLTARDKIERNLTIARQGWLDQPDPERGLHYLRALVGAGGDAAEILPEIDAVIPDPTGFDAPIRAMVATLRGRTLLRLDDLPNALSAAEVAVDAVPADDVARALLAEVLVRLGRAQEALDRDAALEATPSPRPLVSDHLARQTRAAALFRAAVTIGDLADAVNRIGELPADVDPWPSLVDLAQVPTATGSAPAMVAAAAAGLDDARFASAAVSFRPALLADVVESHAAAGGDRAQLSSLDALLAEQEQLGELPDLRRDLVETPTPETAEAYARLATSGMLDLSVEADGLTASGDLDGAELTASLWALAAAAHERRDDLDAAMADAIGALELWPGAIRASILAGRAAASDLPEVALDIVEAVRATGSVDQAPTALRHQLVEVAVEALVAAGDLPNAVGEAITVVEEQGQLQSWPALVVAGVADLERLTLVIGLALIGDAGGFIDAAVRNVAAERTAELCLGYLASGGTNPDAVTTGILAAMLHGRDDLAELFVPHRSLVDPELLDRLADQLQTNGHDTLAAALV